MRKLTLLTFIILLSLAWSAKAEEKGKKTGKKGITIGLGKKHSNNTDDDSTAAADDGKIIFSGYLDTYYNHAFNNPASGSLLGTGGAGRAFDRTVDQFSLGLVQLKTTYTSSKIDIVADLTFGPNAELGNFGNVNNQAYPNSGGVSLYTNPRFANLYGTSAAIKQAYGTWKATSKLSFTVGQFGTHIGYEVIDAPINYNYSLSNLFNNGPFYHVGAKVNYAFSDRFAVMAGLVNNWDNLLDNNKTKDIIAQVYVKPVDGWNVYFNYIGGNGDDTYPNKAYLTGGGAAGSFTGVLNNNNFVGKSNYNRHLFDLTTGYQVTDKLYFGLNAAYGFYKGDDAAADSAIQDETLTRGGTARHVLDWGGVALYSNYQITDWFGIGVRAEHFEDSYGVRYIGGVLGGVINNSLTITAPITLASGHFQLKPEFRWDHSANMAYEDSNGMPKADQATLGLAAIFKW